VLSLVRDTRGGNLNDAAFGRRMRGQGPYAALIAARFNVAARRVGLINDRAREGMTGLDCSRFAPPQIPARQLALF
jgi:hypothetical protein